MSQTNTSQKTIVAVWNSSNKGKTETLRQFAIQLLQTYPNHILIAGNATIPLKGDFRLVVEINGIIVGIESQGDPGTNLQTRLIRLVTQYNCDIILCTTRTRGDTVHAVEHIHNNYGYESIWTSTYQISNKSLFANANATKARHLIDLLQNLNRI